MVNAGLAWSCQLSRRRAVCRQAAFGDYNWITACRSKGWQCGALRRGL